MTVRKGFLILAVFLPILFGLWTVYWPPAGWMFIVLVPAIILGIYDMAQRKHTLLRLYPVIGHLRYLLESVRVEIQQYFVETDIDGRPISREFRELVYRRAKDVRDTQPFGTRFDVYRDGYEWIDHSLRPVTVDPLALRVRFGESECEQPYVASCLNISAMSFGALSKNAIEALNKGASMGKFAHNTGEGGLSPYHLKHKGDVIWQIGTGYFGCRTHDGSFDAELFADNARQETVKMIEIKLSQGAKPGHGGILPAIKLTPEIAEIRHVPLGYDVISPPAHTAFSDPLGLLEFVVRLRELSGGKPVGFKLCLGRGGEFLSICKAMLESHITPDFITIDGGEGGTGAAPVEFGNSVGRPLRDGLMFVQSALIGTGLRDRIRLIASGKVFSAFHMLRLMALGADTVNSARAMMLALGCVQSRTCDTDTCPTGVATQNPARFRRLDIEDKSIRVRNYHTNMIEHLAELLGAAGLESPDLLRPSHINRRIGNGVVSNYQDIYPCLPHAGLLEGDAPESWKRDWERASAASW